MKTYSKRSDGKRHTLRHSEWNVCKSMLCWVKDKSENKNVSSFSDNNFPFYPNNRNIDNIFIFALLFLIGHELHHIKYHGQYTNAQCIEEEYKCDLGATNMILNAQNDYHYLFRAKGVSIGFIFLNVDSIYSRIYGGGTHPLSYDRLINSIENHFGKENDKVWGFIVAILQLHLTERNLVPTNQTECDTFYDCMVECKRILEQDMLSYNK